MSSEEFSLNWDDHHKTLVGVFEKLLEQSALVDCTIAAEGQYLKAHKIILSACSPYFEMLFTQENEKNPIVILKDIKFLELKAMIDFIYRGSVKVSQDRLQDFVDAAESLQIKGLGIDHKRNNSERTVKSLHADRNRISPIPRKHIQIRSLSKIQEYESDVPSGSINSSECISSENLSQSQRKQSTPTASPMSVLTCPTITPAISTPPVTSNVDSSHKITEKNFSSAVQPAHQGVESMYPDPETVVKIEPTKHSFEEVFLPESQCLVEPKEEVGEDEIVLSDGDDEMTESLMEDASSQQSTNQYSSFLPSQETQMGEDSSYRVPQMEHHPSAQGAALAVPEDSSAFQHLGSRSQDYLTTTANPHVSTDVSLTASNFPHWSSTCHPRQRRCPICHKAFSSFGLQVHMRSHAGERPFKCSQCQYETQDPNNLRIHQRRHSGEKPYKCPHCDYTSTSISDLCNHKRIHIGERLFKCSECNYATSVSASLRRHIRIHTGEKPYKCPQCDFTTSDISSLKKHARLHIGETPYVCSQCPGRFMSSFQLKRHLIIHATVS